MSFMYLQCSLVTVTALCRGGHGEKYRLEDGEIFMYHAFYFVVIFEEPGCPQRSSSRLFQEGRLNCR